MITADQILAHLVGDYILQSDWMANEKTKRSLAAAVHALTYALPFLFLRPSLAAFAFIVVTHFVIDRWRLARYVCWAKNFIAPPKQKEMAHLTFIDGSERWIETKWGEPAFKDEFAILIQSPPRAWLDYERRMQPPFAYCSATGYDPTRPAWLTTWLLIIADNTLHLICNGIALRYF